MHDVIIVGGSYAGMAAALQLARARKTVAIIDAGQRRNRFAAAAHGLLAHDGTPPADIAREARAQLLRYPTVTWLDDTATSAAPSGEAFTVRTAAHGDLAASRLILASGVVDVLPDVPGLAERWGRSVFHCPYCHGYELNEGPLGVLAVGEVSMHQALLIPDWGPTTFFTNGRFHPDEDQRRQLVARGVTIETAPVTSIEDTATVRLADGRAIVLAGLFVASRLEIASPIAAQLGCEFEDTPLGDSLRTNGMQETTVPHVYACGDIARPAGNLAFAIADGVMAGAAVHRSLIFG
jgi:thioredoxin reductase